MIRFLIEVAGVPAAVVWRYPESADVFGAYLTEKTPLFAVEPQEADLERMQKLYDRVDADAGFPERKRPERELEKEAIYTLLKEKLAIHHVLLMHGSALCMDGQAVIFTAPSGTGKSTHARLWREAFGDRVWMINDDRPLLTLSGGCDGGGGGGVTVHGSPWRGKHRLGRNASAPLKAVVRLTRGAENRIVPVSKAEALRIMLAHAYASENREIMKGIVSMESAVASRVKFYELSCNMERDAALTARQGIFEGISRP